MFLVTSVLKACGNAMIQFSPLQSLDRDSIFTFRDNTRVVAVSVSVALLLPLQVHTPPCPNTYGQWHTARNKMCHAKKSKKSVKKLFRIRTLQYK